MYENNSKEMKYLVRKFSFDINNIFIADIKNYVNCADLSLDSTLNIAQVLKILVQKNDNFITVEELLTLIETCENSLIKNELLLSISIQIKKASEPIAHLADRLKKLTDGNNADILSSVNILNNEMQSKFSREEFLLFKKNLIRPLANSKKLLVTKNQQKAKNNAKIMSTQMKEKEISGLKEALAANRKKTLSKNTAVVAKEPVLTPEIEGDDRSIFRDTFYECKNLSNLVFSGKMLKKDDKDNYLPQKFLCRNNKYTGNFQTLKAFLTDMLIAHTFYRISNKQQLGQEAIRGLLKCMQGVEQLKQYIFFNHTENYLSKENSIDYQLFFYYFNSPNSLHEENKILNELLVSFKNIWDRCVLECYAKKPKNLFDCKKCDKHTDELDSSVNNWVRKMRREAIISIHNCLLRDKSILNTDDIEKLEGLIGDDDEVFKMHVLKVLTCRNDSDYKTIFNSYLESLANLGISEDIYSALIYLNEQTKDANRCKELFTTQNMPKLINTCLSNKSYSNEHKISIFEIVQNCMEFSCVRGLTSDSLEACFKMLKDESLSQELKLSIFNAIYHTVEKEKELDDEIIEYLTDDHDSYNGILLMILEKMGRSLKSTHLSKISMFLSDESEVLINQLNKNCQEVQSK